MSGEHSFSRLSVVEGRINICGWPTDTVSIDHAAAREVRPHTLLLFVPGNPGVIHWYVETLSRIVEELGGGYAARGVSYAGHGVGEDVVGSDEDHAESFDGKYLREKVRGGAKGEDGRRDMSVAWTMEGQIRHKVDWIDGVLDGWRGQRSDGTGDGNRSPNLIFITHSIGAHFVQTLLIRRNDLAEITSHVVHVMPFFRFDPPRRQKLFLSAAARNYRRTIPMMTGLTRALSSTLPRGWIDLYMEKVVGLDCDRGRALALDIFMHPAMVRNHLVLGLEELREVPEHPNDVALRLIGKTIETSILFCGDDQWAPEFHRRDLQRMQTRGRLPDNIHTEHIDRLRHDFVVHPEQIAPVVKFCVERIKSGGGMRMSLRSRL